MFQKQIVRLILFALIVGGAIYLFATGRIQSDYQKIKGEKVHLPLVIDQQVKKITKDVLPQTRKIVEETELAQEIEAEVNEAMKDLKGYTDEQKKEIKKQIIRQIADQLIKQIEENE